MNQPDSQSKVPIYLYPHSTTVDSILVGDSISNCLTLEFQTSHIIPHGPQGTYTASLILHQLRIILTKSIWTFSPQCSIQNYWCIYNTSFFVLNSSCVSSAMVRYKDDEACCFHSSLAQPKSGRGASGLSRPIDLFHWIFFCICSCLAQLVMVLWQR